MSTVTPNFNWPVPTSTDLVKDGATAIEALGDSIDASLVDLKGGTTGQVLSKTSNTDMDFTWVAADDTNAIQNTIVDAKGDLIAASAADTPARLAVGNNGETIVADSSTATGLRYQSNYAAGKNKIINGDFGIWQRGTSGFSTGGAYNADRFAFYADGSGGTRAITQQTFTAGTAPVAGYEGQYFWRYNQSVAGTGGTENSFYQPIEDVRTFAGQTMTFSFWAKADSTRTVTVFPAQKFGSGGSSQVIVTSQTASVGTSWTRYSFTFAVPSISGKTIGTNSGLFIYIQFPVNTTQTWDIWGVQAEAGSVATAFQTATGTLQGELAACQRYYWRNTTGSSSPISQIGIAQGGTTCDMIYTFPVTMRSTISAIDYSAIQQWTPALSGGQSGGTYAINANGTQTIQIRYTHGSSVWTAGQGTYTYANASNGYIGFSAEL